jgi:IQ calmodulin-binding motif
MNKPLKNLIFCGIHARVKNPRLWKDTNNLDDKAILIQKIWRGYSVRSWIKLAGPGTLNRSVCHNEEELVTFDDRKSVYPLDYFAFREADKVYWFDVRSIIQNSMNKLQPTNPYTREPLSVETRQRLRKLSIKRIYKGFRNVHTDMTPLSADELINIIWLTVCQIIEENGFFDISPLYFTSLNRSQLYVFIQLMHRDLIAWAAEHRTRQSRRKRYISMVSNLRTEYMSGVSERMLCYLTGKCVLSMLNDYPEQYPLCFIIMSALHRV